MESIIQKEDPLLRKEAKEVNVEDIKSRKVETIIRRMEKALDKEDDGIAIAAPQIGESLRIFVVSKKVFEIMEEEKDPTNKLSRDKEEYKNLVFINPEIIKTSKEQMLVEEGCLSVRWLYGQVKRARKVMVKAFNQDGKSFTFGASGLMSQVFQHEIDHLNGILFIDKARGLKEMIPDKKNDNKQK